MARDPVCGVETDEKTTAYKSIYANNVYYFHSLACQEMFNKNPETYLKETGAQHHATHYGGYCGVQGCGPPARGTAWYLYLGLLAMLLSVLLLALLFA